MFKTIRGDFDEGRIIECLLSDLKKEKEKNRKYNMFFPFLLLFQLKMFSGVTLQICTYLIYLVLRAKRRNARQLKCIMYLYFRIVRIERLSQISDKYLHKKEKWKLYKSTNCKKISYL